MRQRKIFFLFMNGVLKSRVTRTRFQLQNHVIGHNGITASVKKNIFNVNKT